MRVLQGGGPAATSGYTPGLTAHPIPAAPAAAPSAPAAPNPGYTQQQVHQSLAQNPGASFTYGVAAGGQPVPSVAPMPYANLSDLLSAIPNAAMGGSSTGSSGGSGGSAPGFATGGSYPTGASTIFDTDPAVAAARAQEQLGIPKISSQLHDLVARLVTNYGDPQIASMAGFGLDPQDAAFARQNYLAGNAELARIDQGHKQNLRKVINTLAGHGLLFSGDTGYQTGLENQAYGNTVYDAQGAAVQQIIDAINSASQQKQQLENNLTGAYENAFNTYTSNQAYYALINALTGGSGGSTSSGSEDPTATDTGTEPSTGGNGTGGPTPPTPRLTLGVKKPKPVKALVNPYTTGQKRTG